MKKGLSAPSEEMDPESPGWETRRVPAGTLERSPWDSRDGLQEEMGGREETTEDATAVVQRREDIVVNTVAKGSRILQN